MIQGSEEPRDRALRLQGRLQVLKELVQLADQMGEKIDIAGSDEANLPVLIQNWKDLHRWMEQARDETLDEIKLLKSGA